MKKNNAPLKCEFAISSTRQEIIHISEVHTRGKQCNCYCPNCGQPMVSKIGSQRRPHFAHITTEASNCTPKQNQETGLHLYAKKLFVELAGKQPLVLPPFSLSGFADKDRNPKDSRQIEPHYLDDKKEPFSFHYKYAQLEKNFKDYKVDVLLNDILAVEILVTHHIDKEKEKKLVQDNRAAIEIDISKFINTNAINVEELVCTLFTDTSNKKWIYRKKH